MHIQTSSSAELRQEYLRTEYTLVMREKARRDIAVFNQLCFGWPAHAVPLHDEWHHIIDRAIATGRNVLLMAPRDHGKTQQIARARILWELGRSTDPRLGGIADVRIKLFQNTDQKASETIQQIERDIQANPMIRRIFPRLVPSRVGEWNKHQMFVPRVENLRDASLEGAGVGSSMTGGRGDVLFMDDVCDFKNTIAEPTTRERIIRLYDSAIANLKEPGRPTIAIATAWHEEDLNAQFQKREDWDCYVWRVQPKPGGPIVPLWPDKWSEAALLRRKGEIGRREFERMFNNRPWGEDDALVNWSDVQRCFRPDLMLGEIPPGRHLVNKVVGYDLAISMRDEAAYFAAIVLGVIGEGQVIPLEIIRKRLPFRQQIEVALRLERKWRPTVHVVENNAYQEAFIAQVKVEDRTMAVEGFTTGKQKMDPDIGLPSLAPSFEAGQWLIPTSGGEHAGGDRCECPLCVWLKELRHYPGASSDILMASWFAFNRARLLGASAGDVVIEEAEMTSLGADIDLDVEETMEELGQF